MSSLVDQVNAALGKHYKALGQGDRFYKDEEGKETAGLFAVWCDDNGMDDATLEEEFKNIATEPKECLLLDFDIDNFPLPPNQQNLHDDDRKIAIAELIKDWKKIGQGVVACTQKDFDSVTQHEVQEMIKIYQTYCPAIYNQGMKVDTKLLSMLTLQYRIGFEYLQYLVDAYNVYRIRSGDTESLSPEQWVSHPNNGYFEKAKSSKPNFQMTVAYCMKTYLHRIAPKLLFQASTRIDDSIERIMEYLAGAARFVRSTIKFNDNVLLCPFQIDFCIVVGTLRVDAQSATANDDAKKDEEDDDDDDDDDDDGGMPGPEVADPVDPGQDFVGIIKSKLEGNGLKYTQPEEEDAADDKDRLERVFNNLLNKLAGNHLISEDGKKHYLSSKRLVSFVDRRRPSDNGNDKEKEKEKKDEGKDDVFMFEPPEGQYTSSIPIGNGIRNVPEWYFSASRTCLLPGDEQFDAEVAVGNKPATKKANDNGKANVSSVNIGATSPAGGQILTFSFHVPAAERVKLYLFWNGQSIRLLPEDIPTLFAKIFVQSDQNKAFTEDESKEREMLTAKLKEYIVDEEFMKWLANANFPDPKKK